MNAIYFVNEWILNFRCGRPFASTSELSAFRISFNVSVCVCVCERKSVWTVVADSPNKHLFISIWQLCSNLSIELVCMANVCVCDHCHLPSIPLNHIIDKINANLLYRLNRQWFIWSIIIFWPVFRSRKFIYWSKCVYGNAFQSLPSYSHFGPCRFVFLLVSHLKIHHENIHFLCVCFRVPIIAC